MTSKVLDDVRVFEEVEEVLDKELCEHHALLHGAAGQHYGEVHMLHEE